MIRLGKQLLEEAATTIDARGDHYGTPMDNFTRIARLWSVILDTEVTPMQVGRGFALRLSIGIVWLIRQDMRRLQQNA